MVELYSLAAQLWVYGSILAIVAIVSLAISLHHKSKDLEESRDKVSTLRAENHKLNFPDLKPDGLPERSKYESIGDYRSRVWQWLRLETFVDTRISTAASLKAVREGNRVHRDAQTVVEDTERKMREASNAFYQYSGGRTFPNARSVQMDDIFRRPEKLPNRRVAWELPEGAPFSGLRHGAPVYSPRHETPAAFHRRLLAYAVDGINKGLWTTVQAADWMGYRLVQEESKKTANFFITTSTADTNTPPTKKVTDILLEKACNKQEHHQKHDWMSRRKVLWYCPGK